jgi:hypothetical protein
MAEFEPGDDICPPWPWWWHGPRPRWLDDSVLEVSRQIFAGLTLINVASKLADTEVGLQLARTGAALVGKQAEELNRTLGQAGS